MDIKIKKVKRICSTCKRQYTDKQIILNGISSTRFNLCSKCTEKITLESKFEENGTDLTEDEEIAISTVLGICLGFIVFFYNNETRQCNC